MSKSEPNPTPIDAWDLGLRELLLDAGIDPDRNAPLTKAQRRKQYLRRTRKTMGATVAAVAAAWVIVQSGAPAAAYGPLLAWFAAWLCRSYWRAAGSPGPRQLAAGVQQSGQRALVLFVRRTSRVWYPISRTLRARLRARRLAVVPN